MKVFKFTLLGLLAVFIIIQFIPNDLPETSNDLSNDFALTENVNEEVKMSLSVACYDCHSNQTSYPWYSFVAPVSWLVTQDVEKGRGDLNFSDWATLKKRKKIKLLSEVVEEVEDGKMPLKIYTVTHKEAKLSEEDKAALINLMNEISDKIMNGE